jgi:hypothetical protein
MEEAKPSQINPAGELEANRLVVQHDENNNSEH